MNCGTCKHWQQSEGDYYHWLCHTKDMKLGECMMAWPGYSPAEQNKHEMAAVCEGEGIYGQLITQDSFYCKLYELKEA
jgi:hypothetical protein